MVHNPDGREWLLCVDKTLKPVACGGGKREGDRAPSPGGSPRRPLLQPNGEWVRGEYFCVCWSGGGVVQCWAPVPMGRRLCRWRSQDWEPDWMEQWWNRCQGFTYTGKRSNQSGQTGSRSPWDHLRLKCGIDLRTNPDLSEEILQSELCFFFFN